MKKLEIKCWLLFLLPLMILLWATSCKSRDVRKSKTVENLETNKQAALELETVDKSQENQKENSQKESEKTTNKEQTNAGFKLTPVDKDKPIIIEDDEGKKTFISNAVYESNQSNLKEETKEKSNESESKETSKANDIYTKINASESEKSKSNSEASVKISNSESALISYWWFILLVIVAVLIWFGYKKYKNLDWKTVFKK